MIDVITLCALKFLSQEPIPEPLRELYQESYTCRNFRPMQNELSQDKLTNINRYFPADRATWPLIINPLESHSAQIANRWIDKGIQPGFLLPKIPNQTYRDNPNQLSKLKTLSTLGAIPIATVDNTLEQTLEATRYYWCMHGACPAGWYLTHAIDETINDTPNHFYITPQYWQNNTNLPLPDRLFTFHNAKILPWNQINPLYEINRNITSYSFVPHFQEKWSYLGIEYQYREGQLQTNFLGESLLSLGEISFWIWDRVYLTEFNIFSLINENFSWIVFLIAMINIFFLIQSAFKNRGAKK